MSHFIEIRLIELGQIDVIIPLLKALDDAIEESVLRQRLTEMFANSYQCVGAFDGTKLIGCCGLWVLTKYYVGKHIEPDNVIILPQYRNRQVGKMLMEWIYNYGKSIGCLASELNCYIQNAPGHKFWMNEGYKIIGFHYQKKL